MGGGNEKKKVFSPIANYMRNLLARLKTKNGHRAN